LATYQIGSSPFGNLIEYDGTILNNNKPSVITDENNILLPSITVATSQNLSAQWATIVQTETDISNMNLPYSPLTQNSNSEANTALLSAGISLPTDSGFWTPAGGNLLLPVISIINSAFHTTFGEGYIDYIPNQMGNPIKASDPLVIDLTGDGISVLPLTISSPYYDLSGTGFADKTAWTGTGTGFLVTEDSSGQINLLTGTSNGGNGFAELAALDSNRDGVINASDPGFSTLYVWQDLNGDGKVETGELQSLASLGIASINLSYSSSNQDINGNTVVGIGSVTMTDGTTRELADVDLQQTTVYSQPDQTPVIPSDIASLPQLHGYGTVTDLHSAMVNDPVLQGMVENFVNLPSNTSYADIMSIVSNIVIQWAGTENATGMSFNSPELEAMDQFLGQQVIFDGHHSTNPGFLADEMLPYVWFTLTSGIAARLLLQGPMSNLQTDFVYNSSLDMIYPTNTIQASIADMVNQFGPISLQSADNWSKASLILDAFRSDVGLDRATFLQAMNASGIPQLSDFVNASSQGLNISFDSSGGLIETGQLMGGKDFFFASGDGHLEINEYDDIPDVTHQDNTLYLSSNITPDMVSEKVDSHNNLILTIGNNGDQITLDNQALPYSPSVISGASYGVQDIVFSNGIEWSGNYLTGSNSDTNLVGLETSTTFDPAGYANIVEGFGSDNDILFDYGYGAVTVDLNGGSGNITLGSDVNASDLSYFLNVETGDLTISLIGTTYSLTIKGEWSETNIDYLNLSDGTAISLATLIFDSNGNFTSDPAIISSNGNTTFTLNPNQTALGGPGTNIFNLSTSSIVVGGPDNNTYVYNPGTGATTIIPKGTGELQINGNVTPSDLILQTNNSNGDLTISITGTNDSILIKGDFSINSSGQVSSKITYVHLSNGEVLNLLYANYIITTDQNGVMIGSNFENNIFSIPQGTTDVVGSSLNNTYLVSPDVGNLYITMGSGNETESLYMEEGFNPSDLAYQADSSGDLIIQDDTTGDNITILNDLSLSSSGQPISRIPYLQFSTGESINLLGVTFNSYATGNGSTLQGNEYGNNALYLTSGTGTAIGGHNGSNTFIDAPGNHAVTGGTQNNEYIFHIGDGQLTINPQGTGTESLYMETGFTPSDLSYQADSSGDLIIQDNATGDSITVLNDLSLSSSGQPISRIPYLTFATGASISLLNVTFNSYATGSALQGNDYGNNALYLSAGNGTATGGNNGSNTFINAPGNHTVTGGSQNNTYVFHAGDGQLIINPEGTNSLTLNGISLTDLIYQADNTTGNLNITDTNTGDSIEVNNDLSVGAYNSIQSKIGYLITAGGYSVSLSTLTFTWQGNGQLVGSNFGNNVFQIGLGATSVEAGLHSNSYYINNNASEVTIIPSGDNNSLIFASGNPQDLTYQANNVTGNLTITNTTMNTSVLIQGDLTVNSSGQTISQIPYIGFANGYEVGVSSVTFQSYQDSNGDTVTGSSFGNDEIHLSTGAGEAIGGNNGNNTFDIAAGQHSIIGGSKANTYIFNQGDGQVTITPNGTGSIQFGPGITDNQLLFQADDATGNLTIQIAGTNDIIVLLSDLSDTNNAISSSISQMTFSNGAEYSLGTHLTYTWEQNGGSTLAGSDFGNNIFYIGSNTTSVSSGSNNNTYILENSSDTQFLGDNSHNIQFSGWSTQQIAAAIISSDAGNGFILNNININPASDFTFSTSSIGWVAPNSNIEQSIVDGNQLSGTSLQGTSAWQLLMAGTNDTSVSTMGVNDTVIANTGSLVVNTTSGDTTTVDLSRSSSNSNDQVNAYGNDTIIGGAATTTVASGSQSNLIIQQNIGTVTVDGFDGSDITVGGNGDAEIQTSGENTTVTAESGITTFQGGSDAATFIGDSNNDSIIAGTGALSIITGTGSNTINLSNQGTGTTSTILSMGTDNITASSHGNLSLTADGPTFTETMNGGTTNISHENASGGIDKATITGAGVLSNYVGDTGLQVSLTSANAAASFTTGITHLTSSASGQSIQGGQNLLYWTDSIGGNTLLGGIGGIQANLGIVNNDSITTMTGAVDSISLSGGTNRINSAGTDAINLSKFSSLTLASNTSNASGSGTHRIELSGWTYLQAATTIGSVGTGSNAFSIGGSTVSTTGTDKVTASSFGWIAPGSTTETPVIDGYGNTSTTTIQGTTATELLIVSYADKNVYTGGGNDMIVTSTGNATITTAAGYSATIDMSHATASTTDNIYAYGNDTIIGGSSGNVTVTAGQNANVTLYQNGMAMTFHNANGASVFIGGGRAATITANQGSVDVNAGSGTTIFTGGAEASNFTAGSGNTTVTAGNGGGAFTMGSGYTTFTGGSGNLTFIGGSGSEYITGGLGTGNYEMGSGLVSFVAGSGSTTVEGGASHGTIAGGSANGTVLIAGSGGNSQLTAGTGQSTLYGTANGDTLTAAGSQNDTLVAGIGTETLSAGQGTGFETMIGGSGSDTFKSGSGGSSITAGSGSDLFSFTSGKAGGLYTLNNFLLGADKITMIGYSQGADGLETSMYNSRTSDSNGGTLFTVSDGTRIDVTGIAPSLFTRAAFAD
jgi:Ca2+-binding RTX toxin-like protein